MIDTPEIAVTELQARQSTLLDYLGNVQVTTDAEQKAAEDVLIDAKGALKEAEEKRKELTRPVDETKARIIGLFKPHIERLQNGIKVLNSVLCAYHDQKRIAAEAVRLAALAEQAARFKAAGEGEIIEPLSRSVLAEVAKTSRAHLGTVTYRGGYDIQIVSPRDVPRDLCEPSMPLIRARVNSGVLDIPGVLISRKHTPVPHADASHRRQGGG